LEATQAPGVGLSLPSRAIVQDSVKVVSLSLLPLTTMVVSMPPSDLFLHPVERLDQEFLAEGSSGLLISQDRAWGSSVPMTSSPVLASRRFSPSLASTALSA
jgi:hypothetical protein